MKRFHPLTLLCLLACVAGFVFSAVSTSDFVAHLDRQVHGIHCSFLPGLGEADQSGESGCHTTLMSPYSSIFRSSIWGGIPIALPSMAVFSFLGFVCLWLIVNSRERDMRATGFLFVATLIPLAASGAMGYLSFVELGAACKMCIGIYVSSGVCFLSSLVLWRTSPPTVFVDPLSKMGLASPEPDPKQRLEIQPVSWGTIAVAFCVGCAFVLVPVAGYAAQSPDFSSYVGSCGELPEPNHDPSALVTYGPQTGKTDMLMVLDPLCPSCKGFEERLGKMDVSPDINRKLLLFPLDDACNWMIDRAIHPGACSVSEAILCAEDPAPVIAWAFSKQQEIMAAATDNPKAAANMAKTQFPGLSECIGSPEVQAKLNLSLRWAVKNRLQILTPQVFVEGARLCGEDTDLGLDYALPRLIERMKNRPLPEPTTKVNQDLAGDEGAPGPANKRPKTRSPASKEDRKRDLDDESEKVEPPEVSDPSEETMEKKEEVKMDSSSGDQEKKAETPEAVSAVPPPPPPADKSAAGDPPVPAKEAPAPTKKDSNPTKLQPKEEGSP